MSRKSLVGIGLIILVAVGVFSIGMLWRAATNKTYDMPEQMQDVTRVIQPSPSAQASPNLGCALDYMPPVAIVINGQSTLEVAYAATAPERIKGLAQCPSIPAGKGMYFAVDPNTPTAFWMKGMLTPLDLIWLSENKVIGVTVNVSPPLPGVGDNDLPRYAAPAGTDGVLEVAAGGAALHNIQIDSTISFDTNIPHSAAPSMH